MVWLRVKKGRTFGSYIPDFYQAIRRASGGEVSPVGTEGCDNNFGCAASKKNKPSQWRMELDKQTNLADQDLAQVFSRAPSSE